MNGHEDGDGAAVGTGTGVNVNEGAQDGNGNGSGDGAGTGTGTEARTVAEMGTGRRITRMGTRIGSGRAKERRRSARNRKKALDAMWEMGETCVEREKHQPGRKERVGPVAANPDNLESNKEAGGGHKALRA